MKKNNLVKLLGGLGAIAGAAAITMAKKKNDAYNETVTGGTGVDPDDPDNSLEEFWNRHLKGFQSGIEERKAAAEKVRRSLAEKDGNSLDLLIELAKAYREKEESEGACGGQHTAADDRARAEYLLKVLQGRHR